MSTSTNTNKLTQLNDALFAQLERLADPKNDLKDELLRADAIADLGKQVIASGSLELDAIRLLNSPGNEPTPPSHLISPMFAGDNKEGSTETPRIKNVPPKKIPTASKPVLKRVSPNNREERRENTQVLKKLAPGQSVHDVLNGVQSRVVAG